MNKSLTITLDETLINHAKQHAEHAGKSTDELIAEFISWLDHASSRYKYTVRKSSENSHRYYIHWSGTGGKGDFASNIFAYSKEANVSFLENIVKYGASPEDIFDSLYSASKAKSWLKISEGNFLSGWWQGQDTVFNLYQPWKPPTTHLKLGSEPNEENQTFNEWAFFEHVAPKSFEAPPSEPAEEGWPTWLLAPSHNEQQISEPHANESSEVDLVTLLRWCDEHGLSAADALETFGDKVSITGVLEETQVDYSKNYKEIVGKHLAERYK
jgi:hypothetical protein